MGACAVICRKAHVMLPEANFPFPDATFPSSRAQNRDFCALFAFGTLVFGLFEHKIGIFVRLFYETWPLEAEKRANFFCTLLSCYCLRGTAARAPGIVAPETVAPGTVAPGTVAPETVPPWNRGTACGGTAPPSREQYCYAHIGLM